MQQASFEGYSYRTSSRFGSRVEVSVKDGMVSVTGPRIGVLVYRLWIVTQAILLWLTVPALLAALVLWDWRYLAVAVGLFLLHYGISSIGAVAPWEGATVVQFLGTEGYPKTSFPLSAVRRVMIGRGWARNGLWLVIPWVVPQIDRVAEGHTVSFEAPDGEAGRGAVYALHMRTEADASALAALLEGT
jgi:hypothetical protein